MYRHLMVPVDASMISSGNVAAAIALAKQLDARVTFFHATADLGATGDGALLRAINPEVYAQASQGDTPAVLSKASAAALAAGVPCESIARVCDQPAQVIVEAAKERGCDLIVMASRGLRGFAGWLHSSQTEQVLRQSPIALLVTRVQTNDPLDAGERALAIIQDEHRSIAAVVHGLRDTLARAEASNATPDLVGIRAMLMYLRDFPQQLHHPKEEQLLHPRLRERFAGSAALLGEIERQHARETVLVEDAFARLKMAEKTPGTETSAALVSAVKALADAVWQHIGLEEREVLPLARQHLLASDWSEVAAHFEANNPGFGEPPADDFKRMFSRIARLFPTTS